MGRPTAIRPARDVARWHRETNVVIVGFGSAGASAAIEARAAGLVVDDAVYERPFPPTEIAAVGETVAELEDELGMPEGSLQHTVEYYNRHAEKGADPLFGNPLKGIPEACGDEAPIHFPAHRAG